MSDVKRYTLIDGLLRLSAHPTAIEEAARTHSLFTGEKQVVLAADYDALAAELAGYKESHEKYCPSAERVRQLEAALRKHGRHDPDRCFVTADPSGEPEVCCHCGLEAALAPKEPT